MNDGRFEPLHPMRRPITARQREAYDFIAETWLETGRGPELRVMAKALGFSSSNYAQELVQVLERRGWVVCGPHQSVGTLRPARASDRIRPW